MTMIEIMESLIVQHIGTAKIDGSLVDFVTTTDIRAFADKWDAEQATARPAPAGSESEEA